VPDTFIKIASVTVGSGGASSIDFTSIPSTYTDLCVKVSARTSFSGNTEAIWLRTNGSTTGFSLRYVQGDGASASSGTGTASLGGLVNGNTATSNTFANMEWYIPNYAGSSFKSSSYDGVSENNGTTAYAGFYAGLWSNTAAITSLKIESGNGNTMLQYSTATLYGIKNS
jgi:hypothetical protein